MMYRVAVAFLTVMIGSFILIQSSSYASALDGYRLCAMRKGICSCQKINDGPGVLTVMKESVCTGEPDDQKNSAIGAEAVSPSPSEPEPAKENSSTSAFQIFNVKLPDLSSSKEEKYRLCAMRKGKCKCQKVSDGPGILTDMEESRCTKSPSVMNDAKTEKPPVASKKTIKEAQTLLARAGYDPGPADGAMGPKTRSAIKQFQSKNGLVSNGVASSTLIAALRTAPAKENKTTPAPRPAVAKVKKPAQPAKSANNEKPTSPPSAPKPALASSGSVKLSNCALRSGQCTCKTPEDGPRQWTIVGAAQCKRTLFVNLWDKPATSIDASPQTIKGVQKKLNSLGYDAGQADGNLGLKTTTAITSFQNSVGMPVDGKITDILLQRLSDLAPDEVSQPVYADIPAPITAAPQPSVTQQAPENKRKTPPVDISSMAPAQTDPPTNEETASTVPSTNPLAGLFGGGNSNSGLPTSMDGYRNCALRKGKCLCQKLTDDAGVWTSMEPSVCTGHLTRASEPDSLQAPTRDASRTANTEILPAKKTAAKTEPVVASPVTPEDKKTPSFLDSISRALSPDKRALETQ